MSRPRKWLLPLLGCVVLVAGCGEEKEGDEPDPTPSTGRFDGQRAYADVRTQVDFGPRPAGSPANRRLTRWIAAELRDAGADRVGVQRPERNVVGILPGEEPGYVVVGAHHDTPDLPGVVGANDGASGVAVVLELARSLPRPLQGPSVALALFDAEEARPGRPFHEDGKRGSTQYVRMASRSDPPPGVAALGKTRAMVLFDMVGDCDLQIPREASSDERLHGLFADANPDVFAGEAPPVDDDHVPFLEAGVPAVNLIDFTFGPGGTPGAYWHTPEDTPDKVCPDSLQAVGDAALEAIPAIR